MGQLPLSHVPSVVRPSPPPVCMVDIYHLIEHNEGTVPAKEQFPDIMYTVSLFCAPVVNRGILDFIDEMKTKETGGTEGKIRLCMAVTCRSASGHAPTSRSGFVLCVISESNVMNLSSQMLCHA